MTYVPPPAPCPWILRPLPGLYGYTPLGLICVAMVCVGAVLAGVLGYVVVEALV